MNWYAVGEIDGECGWISAQAKTEAEAEQIYRKENDTPDDCEVCANFIQEWQGKEGIGPLDWFFSKDGLTWACSRCSEQTNKHDDDGSTMKNGEIICGYCNSRGEA